MARFTITQNRFREAGQLARLGLADGLVDVTEACLTEANTTVPLEEGTLERSGFAEVDRAGLQGQVAYDTPYAVIQHEDPELHHDPGRRSHWLEQTVAENRATYESVIAARVRRRF